MAKALVKPETLTASQQPAQEANITALTAANMPDGTPVIGWASQTDIGVAIRNAPTPTDTYLMDRPVTYKHDETPTAKK